MQAASK